MEMEEKKYPMRLNRYLALEGICSRREADALIERGVVKVNGKKAVLGQKILEADLVEIDGDKKDRVKQYVYFAYHKPKGIITHSPKAGEIDIRQKGKIENDVFPVGRLDKESRGLIILTNDGRVNKALLLPENEHEKEYVVMVDRPIINLLMKKLEQGVDLEDFTTKPAQVKQIDEREFRIILTEGKKHQIRRMCAAFGYGVVDLKRTRIENIFLSGIGAGNRREIVGKELKEFLGRLGIEG